MIARLWHGWTSRENAGAYETLLRNQVLPLVPGPCVARDAAVGRAARRARRRGAVAPRARPALYLGAGAARRLLEVHGTAAAASRPRRYVPAGGERLAAAARAGGRGGGLEARSRAVKARASAAAAGDRPARARRPGSPRRTLDRSAKRLRYRDARPLP